VAQHYGVVCLEIVLGVTKLKRSSLNYVQKSVYLLLPITLHVLLEYSVPILLKRLALTAGITT
jgi:hypothetical protein